MAVTETPDVLTRQAWVSLLSREYPPADEVVALALRLRTPYTLSVSKADLARCFGPCAGIRLDVDRVVRVRASDKGARRIDLSGGVVERLALRPRDTVCVTRRQDDGAWLLKRFTLVAGRTEVPGRVLVDSFTDTQVTRTHYSATDLGALGAVELKGLAAAMGRLRHDPFRPFEQVGGWVGLLFRREFGGGAAPADEAFLSERAERISRAQRADGSWDGGLAATAFALLRLAEAGQDLTSPAIEKGVRWVLASPEPVGLPGLFVATPQLAQEFNRWKQSGVRASGAAFKAIDRSRHAPVRQTYARNRDVLPGLCDLSLTSATAVALKALLRLGMAEERRVRLAIHTMLALWNGRWCGCAVKGTDKFIEPCDAPVDFSGGFPLPTRNDAIYRGDWFTDEEQLRRITAHRSVSPHYAWRQIAPRAARIDKHSVGMGDCTLGVHEALSYHPAYAGSNLETIAALELVRRQSVCGAWGDTPASRILHTLGRLSHPLASFCVLRSIPLLLRRQRPDGFWPADDELPQDTPPDAATSLRILSALKRHALLESLLPS